MKDLSKRIKFAKFPLIIMTRSVINLYTARCIKRQIFLRLQKYSTTSIHRSRVYRFPVCIVLFNGSVTCTVYIILIIPTSVVSEICRFPHLLYKNFTVFRKKMINSSRCNQITSINRTT